MCTYTDAGKLNVEREKTTFFKERKKLHLIRKRGYLSGVDREETRRRGVVLTFILILRRG